MTRDDPRRDQRTSWARALLAVLAVTLSIALIQQLHDRTPRADTAGVVPVGGQLSREAGEVVDCQRRTREGSQVESAFPGGPQQVPRVSSTDVASCPVRYDGHRVEFVGEVVGDVLRRDGGAWVLMNDDAYALASGPLPAHQEFAGGNSGLAVWLDGALADQARVAGGPGVRGDVLRVRGVIRRADPADGGGLTLRADSGEVVAEGVRVPQPVHTAQAVVAVLLALAALALVVAERYVARSR